MRADDPRAAAAAFTRGAVDLSALKARPASRPQSQAGAPQPATGSGAPASSGNGAADGGVTIIDVTEATFQSEVLERSLGTPVVIDFWAEWCGPCKQLSPVLEKLAVEGGGRWVLAKIDVDANQRIAQAFRVQTIPMVYAVIGGQPEAAQKAGIGSGAGEPAAEPTDERVDAAEDAIASGDFDGAEQIYQRIL